MSAQHEASPEGSASAGASSTGPLVEVRDLAKVFDVSAPWLNRVVERLRSIRAR